MSLETFTLRGEHILIGFLKEFFSQASLFTNLPNEFEYVDNTAENSLILEMAGDFNHETVDAIPTILIQEHGFNEGERIVDHGRKRHDFQNLETHTSQFVHRYTLHCITRYRGTSKILQSAVAGAISMFRKAIYQMGVDHIFPLQGHPPRRLSTQKDEPNTHDSAVTLRMRMRKDWELDRYDDPEEQVRVKFRAAIEDTATDDEGRPVEYHEDTSTVTNS